MIIIFIIKIKILECSKAVGFLVRNNHVCIGASNLNWHLFNHKNSLENQGQNIIRILANKYPLPFS